MAGQQGLWAGACCLGALLSRAPGWQASVLPSKSLCVKEKSLAQEGDTPGKFRITKDTGEAHCPPHVSALAPCCSAPRSGWCPTGRIYGGALSRPSGPFLSPRQAWRLWEGDNPTPSWGDPASAWCSWLPRGEPSASRSVPGPLGRPEATTPAPASGLSPGPLKSCAPPLRSWDSSDAPASRAPCPSSGCPLGNSEACSGPRGARARARVHTYVRVRVRKVGRALRGVAVVRRGALGWLRPPGSREVSVVATDYKTYAVMDIVRHTGAASHRDLKLYSEPGGGWRDGGRRGGGHCSACAPACSPLGAPGSVRGQRGRTAGAERGQAGQGGASVPSWDSVPHRPGPETQ